MTLMFSRSLKSNLKLIVAAVPPIFATLAITVLSRPALATLESVTVSSEDHLMAPRFIYGSGETPQGKSVPALLAQLKNAQIEHDNKSCLKLAKDAKIKAKSLQGWIAAVELECATDALIKTPKKEQAQKLVSLLEQVSKNPIATFVGPQAAPLRKTVIRGYLAQIEHDTKSDRTRAWRAVEKLQELNSYLDERQKGNLYQMAGEITYLQQKLEAARDLLQRSLIYPNDGNSEQIRERIRTIESAIASNANAAAKKNKKNVAKNQPAKAAERSVAASVNMKTPAPVASDASQEELELVDSSTAALKTGDVVLAVEDAVKLVKKFPGGTRAKWAADRILDVYTSFIDKDEPKYEQMRQQIVKQIGNGVDSDRVAEWARIMYNRGQYSDSLALAQKSLETMDGIRRTKVLDLAIDAAIGTENYDVAREMLSDLIVKHAGTPLARKALLRSGLLYYRLGKYDDAVAEFERLLSLQQIESLEIIGRYWMWRALQKQNSARADSVADELLQKFPFSYYGLRARIERSGNVLDWKFEKEKLETKIWLTGPEHLAWEKTLLLLKAGWLEEAQSEIKELPLPLRAEDKALRSMLWAAAGAYTNASKLANEAWDEKPNLRRAPFVESAFPAEFIPVIEAQAGARKIDRDLVRGLIKQESAYSPKATSTSNAYGLMQIIPPTAKEIAVDLKLGTLQLPDDLFQPKRNIQMGTYYISRLITKYKGYVPLALAAYNAGPGRMDKWLKMRPSLKSLPGLRSSAADDELWFDEIPYNETSLYVKAILRNILLYRLLDKGRVEIANPLWAFEVSGQ